MMSVISIEALKALFQTGDVPTGPNFEDFIDTVIDLASNSSGAATSGQALLADGVSGAYFGDVSSPVQYNANNSMYGPYNQATLSHFRSIAFGVGAAGYGNDQVIIGPDAKSYGLGSGGSIVIGHNAENQLVHGLVVGQNGYNASLDGIVIGSNARINDNLSGSAIIVGAGANADNSAEGICIGHDASIYQDYAVGVGPNSYAGGVSASAFGHQALASGLRAIAIGFDPHSTGDDSISMGNHSRVSGEHAIGIGAYTYGYYYGSIGLGGYADPSAAYGVGIGFSVNPNGQGNVCIGGFAGTSNLNAIAVGYSASAQFESSIAIGPSVIAARANSARIGPNNTNVIEIDNSAVAGNTCLLIYDVDNATIERVTVGASDSGGAGFKVLRIPN